MPDNLPTISTLKAKLAPPSDAELARLVSVLLAQWSNVRAGETDLRVDGYMLALRGYAAATVKTCITAAIRGEIGRPEFLPLAPELSAWCRSYEKFDRAELARLMRPVAVEHHREIKREKIAKGFENLSAVLARTIDLEKLGGGDG